MYNEPVPMNRGDAGSVQISTRLVLLPETCCSPLMVRELKDLIGGNVVNIRSLCELRILTHNRPQTLVLS
jgi:hypothetical protein